MTEIRIPTGNCIPPGLTKVNTTREPDLQRLDVHSLLWVPALKCLARVLDNLKRGVMLLSYADLDRQGKDPSDFEGVG